MQSPSEAPHRHIGQELVGFASLILAILQSICAAAVMVSGVRVLFGLSSLISATAAGPAHGFHSNKLRLTFLILAALGAVVSLWTYWNESRLRNDPAAQWRMKPMDKKLRIRRQLQLWLAVITLVLVAAETITHPWFHHEF